ncbi:phospholipase effector Tle1 domain-containing protein [Aestuariirhabdus litorea]|uniref:DUF2235 domain-containing protein n=1 Tax=Aestuariirhabdus litorea TaxID=2528527 RepID=A0A3P3VNS5_9GAMM|nr:DUF2235 domain-containing protein [Aestuariirhabdus litorea]RRJ82473.1 hypothetical protein D0544_11400 [Aestuariirhabdus litorea]RWW92634.1 hypothetical protein DZC74_11375 [Endozoicomonadaceae bacterium GTF-13]
MAKRILLFLDGSWVNTAGPSPRGNLQRLMEMVTSPDEGEPTQLVYYDSDHHSALHWRTLLGVGVRSQVLRAYDYLITHYQRGDHIYCFGASRGAWVARHLCGFLDRVGLLPMQRRDQAYPAYRLYRIEQQRGLRDSERSAYESCYRHNALPEVRMLGVWDTLGAEGVPVPGFMSLSARIGLRLGRQTMVPTVHVARQAMALDELRAPFKVAPWLSLGSEPGQHPEVEQLWFAGSHADVCGYGDPYLGDRSLLWMAEEAQEAGLALRPEALQGLRYRITRQEQQSESQTVKNGHSPQVTRAYSQYYRYLERIGWHAESRAVGSRQRAERGKEPILGEAVHPSVDTVIGVKAGFYRPANLLEALASGQVRYAYGYQPQYSPRYYPDSERRRGERESCLDVAELNLEGGNYECLVLDRSESGLGIRCKGPLREGSVISLKAHAERRRARVMWVHEERAGIAFAA